MTKKNHSHSVVLVAGSVGRCQDCGGPIDEWEDERGRFLLCPRCEKIQRVRLYPTQLNVATFRLKTKGK